MPYRNFKKLFLFIWDSPTITTWASILSRTLSLVLVLPLILTSFVPSHIALWYLFLSFIGLQSLVDLGFGQSFIRAIAFANGGSTKLVYNGYEEKIEGANWSLIHKIVQTMRWIYIRISLGGFLFLVTLGSLSLVNVIEKTPDPFISWFSWAIIITMFLPPNSPAQTSPLPKQKSIIETKTITALPNILLIHYPPS